jgi:hypothetical protein
MRLLFIAYRSEVQFESILKSHQTMAAPSFDLRISGTCRMNIHFSAFCGIPGAAQGEQYPNETSPAFA